MIVKTKNCFLISRCNHDVYFQLKLFVGRLKAILLVDRRNRFANVSF